MSDFGDRPFAAGSLFGIRSFRVADGGVLTGCVQQSVWHVGLNEAECHRSDAYSFAQVMAQLGASAAEFSWTMMHLSAQMTGRVLLTKRPKPPPPRPARPALPPHDAGTMSCTCGYYAYFDRGHNPHHRDGNILGIVEGFGIVTVGSRGFRASKARIRAFITDGDFELGFALPAIMPNYPGVPVFHSVEAALAEFPLTPIEQPEPVGLRAAPRYRPGGFVPAAWTTGITAQQWAACEETCDETPKERALRMRRERNTGPTAKRGLDGQFRRGAAR